MVHNVNEKKYKNLANNIPFQAVQIGLGVGRSKW
jgi:hypothetical protein